MAASPIQHASPTPEQETASASRRNVVPKIPLGMEGGQDNFATTGDDIDLYAQTAPEFPAGLDWLNTERPLSLAQLRGKVVLLDFWTYGCINCIHNFPELKRLQSEYPDELVIIGVHSAKFPNEKDTENIRQIILRYGLEHPIVNDADRKVWYAWNVRAWPTLVLIDPSGAIADMHIGEGVYRAFKPVINMLVTAYDKRGRLDRTPLSRKLEREGLPATVLAAPGKVLADERSERLFIADTNHNRIVIADADSGQVVNVIGSGTYSFQDGDFQTAAFARPQGLALTPDGQQLYVADTENHAIRRVDLATGQVTTVAGTGQRAREYPPTGGFAPDVALNSPWDLVLASGQLYIAMAGSHQIWQLDLATGAIGPLVGNGLEGTHDGPLYEATLAQPSGLAWDGRSRLYFADSESSSIRWADLHQGQTGTLVGSGVDLFEFGDIDGVGRQARLQHPLGVVFRPGGLFVADTYNHKIKWVDLEKQAITTFLGSERGWRDGPAPLFYEPGGLALAGDTLYVADTNNHVIRAVDLSTRETSTLVLKGIEPFLPPADSPAYNGRLIRLQPATVRPGPGKWTLDVRLPAGYKLNGLAPSTMEWHADAGVMTLPAEANGTVQGAAFPLTMDVVFNAGEGMLAGDLTIFYCEATKQSLCLIDQAHVEIPLQITPMATQDMLTVHYAIELPPLE